jgi:hypothetical protein
MAIVSRAWPASTPNAHTGGATPVFVHGELGSVRAIAGDGTTLYRRLGFAHGRPPGTRAAAPKQRGGDGTLATGARMASTDPVRSAVAATATARAARNMRAAGNTTEETYRRSASGRAARPLRIRIRGDGRQVAT